MKVFNPLFNRQWSMLALGSCCFFALAACNKDDDHYEKPIPEPTAQQVAAAGDVLPAVNSFRGLIGDSLNTTLPSTPDGRREVNWDGVPSNLTNNAQFPLDFFNPVDPNIGAGRKRGLVYTNNPNSLRVDSSLFAEINPSYSEQFSPFSNTKLIAPINSNTTDAEFRLAGTNTPAFVKGFGLVFSDVDDSKSSSIEYFNGNKSLGKFYAPVRKDAKGHSFLGVYFPDEKITKVRIQSGNGVLSATENDLSSGGTKDLVTMDDFFYSEPVLLQ